MVHIILPEEQAATKTALHCQTRRLSFYLAMEEFVAKELRQFDECFFAWQVEPTVIFGRNQLIQSEVNIKYCQEHHIDMIRRKSGGGCVYADMSNIMFSYINTGWNVTLTFEHYINMVADMLRSLGIDATTSSRNDIMIDGRKVSGNAFYHIPGRNIVHGTMLYDTDMQNMLNAITPDAGKLQSKGVESVRQHICLLKDYIGHKMNINQFRQYACREMCDAEYLLTPDDIEKIEEIQQEYHDPNYILGHNPAYEIKRHLRIEGAGDFVVNINLKNNVVKNINILGDFFLIGDINELLAAFTQVPYTTAAIKDIAKKLSPSQVVMGLTPENLVKLLID